MKEHAYNIIKTKDSRTQRQSNLKSKEARFKISPQEFEDHTVEEIFFLLFSSYLLSIILALFHGEVKAILDYNNFFIQQRSKGSDESSNSSSRSSSDSLFAVEDISSDVAEVTKKANNTKIAYVEKDTNDQVANEQVVEKKAGGEEHDLVEPKVQSMVDVPVKQAKPAALRPLLVGTTVTLIPDAIRDDDVSLENRVYRIERHVHAMSRFSIQEDVDKSIKAHLKQVDLSKDVPDFAKIKQEKAAKQSRPKHSSTPFNKAALDIYDQKEKLYKMMREFKAYNRHPAHKALFNSLVVSLNPSIDADKDSKKKKRKDHDVSSSKKTKDHPTSSKGTTLSKSSKTNKTLQAKETIEDSDQEGGMDEKPTVDEVVNNDDHSQDDTAPSQDKSKWFKRSPRPETPDLKWHKELMTSKKVTFIASFISFN
ncbi:hypothetical protein Tco_1290196 [Tanacetum coccineum]